MTPNWQKVEFFKPEEFVHPELLRQEMLDKLDELRFYCGFPLKITSSWRDPEHNKAVGGVQDSAHLPDPTDGKYSGIDIATEGIGGAGLYKLLHGALACGFNRIGIYPKHWHFDVEDRLPQQVIWVGKD